MARLKTTWFDVEQNSPEWREARRGKVTASRIADVLAKGEGKVRERYLHDLAGEIITGDPVEEFSNKHTQRGQELEPEARDAYELVTGMACERVGFAFNGLAGASPDSRVGPKRGLEIKTALPRLLVGMIASRKFPREHYPQCQCVLWVCNWSELDLVVYWPKMPLFRWTVERDAKYIKVMADEVARFNDDLNKLVRTVRSYGKK